MAPPPMYVSLIPTPPFRSYLYVTNAYLCSLMHYYLFDIIKSLLFIRIFYEISNKKKFIQKNRFITVFFFFD